MAETKTNETKATKTVEKKVKIKLPLSRTEKDDVYVSVNGRSWLIKRGVEVEVPYYVAEVLKHQEKVLEGIIELEENSNKTAE